MGDVRDVGSEADPRAIVDELRRSTRLRRAMTRVPGCDIPLPGRPVPQGLPSREARRLPDGPPPA